MIKSFDGFVSLESRGVLEPAKVIKSIFVFFDAEFFDFAVVFEEFSDLIFDLFFRVIAVEVGEEDFVAVGVFFGSERLFFLDGRGT